MYLSLFFARKRQLIQTHVVLSLALCLVWIGLLFFEAVTDSFVAQSLLTIVSLLALGNFFGSFFFYASKVSDVIDVIEIFDTDICDLHQEQKQLREDCDYLTRRINDVSLEHQTIQHLLERDQHQRRLKSERDRRYRKNKLMHLPSNVTSITEALDAAHKAISDEFAREEQEWPEPLPITKYSTMPLVEDFSSEALVIKETSLHVTEETETEQQQSPA